MRAGGCACVSMFGMSMRDRFSRVSSAVSRRRGARQNRPGPGRGVVCVSTVVSVESGERVRIGQSCVQRKAATSLSQPRVRPYRVAIIVDGLQSADSSERKRSLRVRRAEVCDSDQCVTRERDSSSDTVRDSRLRSIRHDPRRNRCPLGSRAAAPLLSRGPLPLHEIMGPLGRV